MAGAPMVAQDLAAEAWRLEDQGNADQARERLRRAAEQAPGDAAAQRAYAEFLDRHRDPAAREAYARLEQALERANAPREQRAYAARRLAALALAAGDRASAERYARESGAGFSVPPSPSVEASYIEIPGLLSSFSRMAALSPDLRPSEILPALARNIVTNGYQAISANEALEQTEFLKLVVRYLSQTREIEKLAGPGKVLRIDTCESTTTGDLLRIIGFRMRGGCGSDLVLETVNASRAFLTTDSGFPLAELEQALRTNRPFSLDYRPARIPVLYGVEYWHSAKDKTPGEFIDYFISDPSLCRLYLGLSKLDPGTAAELRRTVPAQRLKIFAHVLDFFGGMFEIREGRAVVPGGARSERTWAELNGVPPERGAAFFEKMIATDDGWLASFFDALARIQGPVQAYLTEPERMKRFYQAIRGKVTSPGPARPVFRSNTDMLLLTTRLRLEPNGRPHVPGGLDVWKSLFIDHPQGKYDARLSRAAKDWREPDDVLEALFGLCRKMAENEPLKIFMAMSDLNRNRTVPLQAATVDRLARSYRAMSAQYPLFAEGSMLADSTILAFLDNARSLSGIRDQALRSDSVGMMQALTGIWQVFTRQGSIRTEEADAALAAILAPFARISSSRELFDAGHTGVATLLTATRSPANASPQDRIIDLLAGTEEASETHDQLVQDMIRVFESQRLVSLTTLFEMADNLDSVSRGEKLNTVLAARLAARFTEIVLPRSAMTGIEKNSQAYGYWSERHIDQQRKLNLRSAIEKAANDAQKLRDLRGQLTPFLRDTLVGFLYMHYAPPGAQVLHTNPLFVRSHDFIGIQGANQTWRTTEVVGTGWPANAGGRLVGSLVSIPYALAEAEQNFLIPTREQALIWGDLVPQILQSAVIPRWWRVSPAQLRWVGLHMSYAEILMSESALSESRRKQVLASLAQYGSPGRLKAVELALAAGDIRTAVENVLPSEMYRLASDVAGTDQESPLARDIRRLAAEAGDQVSAAAISRAFGTPKPTLANTYQPELLNLRTFPTLMGYSSRILAESWESNLLYYAALADEIHARPAELNVLVPRWTQKTVEQIFATHLEDWPALLRSLRAVGDGVREEARRQVND
jgi:tetratricopeptide (TPR) repeat protein